MVFKLKNALSTFKNLAMTRPNVKLVSLINYHENPTQALEKCSKFLHDGNLVAFPTETVYGLGANALNSDAVKKIFEAKQRPLTDPVIVHVLDFHTAISLVDISSSLANVYKYLTDCFWPGPLTIVAKVNSKKIPDCITANTGFVGIRSPRHEIARKLIAVSKLPIAAPSANRFGHVSPTTANHVFEDLGDCKIPILILDTKEKCDVGIESTVAKLEENNGKFFLTILRKGGVSIEQLNKAMNKYKESTNVEVLVNSKTKIVSNDTKIGQQAPGQLITHYAPYIQAFIVEDDPNLLNNGGKEDIDLSKIALIDFGGKMKWAADKVLFYTDLSTKGDILEAANVLFDTLRTCEKIKGAQAIALPNLKDSKLEHADALFDRLFRSASGRYAVLTQKSLKVIN